MKTQISKRILSLLLTLAMCLSLVNLAPAQAASDFSDISGHWGEATIEKWAGHGLVNGKPGGLFAPGDDITRGELAAVLSRLMRYQTVAENTYGDVQDGAWYAEAILQATRAGVLQGDGVNARPEARITREEVMVIMARILNLTGAADAPAFSDAGQISSWAADAVGAMAAKGYVQGNNGMIRPKDNITRVEVLTILDNVFAKLYDEAGTYTEDMAGNVVVNTPDVELKDMSVSGDLLVAQGVAEGDFVLDNVALAGNLIVRGGGVDSIYIINGSTVGGTVSIERNDGPVRVVTDGSVEVVYIDDGSDDVILDGDFDDVTLAAADVTLTVKGSIDMLTVEDTATGATVDVPKGSEVGKVETAADDVTISGEGKVTEVDVTGGDGVSVQTPGTKVVVSEEAGPVDAGGKTIEPGKEGTTQKPPVYYPNDPGGSGDPVVPALAGTASITGTSAFGETLTAAADVTNPVAGETLSYTWKRGDIVISGAAGETYVLVEADVGAAISCEITSDLRGGTIAAAAVGPVTKAECAVAAPSDGVVDDDADTFTFSSASDVVYEWTVDDWITAAPITATGSTASLTVGNVAIASGVLKVRVKETATHLASAELVSDTAFTLAPPPALAGTAGITGTPVFGETLTATVDVTNPEVGEVLIYTWKRSNTVIFGAAGEAYVLVEADIGATISCEITSDLRGGTIAAAAVGPVTKAVCVTAAPSDGVVDDDADTFTFTSVFGVIYEWTVDNWETATEVTATGTTAVIAVGDIALASGALRVRVKETATHLASAELTSDAAFTVAPPPALAGRETLNFNIGWSFSKGTGIFGSGSDKPGMPLPEIVVIPKTEKPYLADYVMGDTWSPVSLPHTYNDEDTFDLFMEDSTKGERTMYAGTAWYKKNFTIPAEYAGKKVFLEFEGARQAADVYINGEKLDGRSENGFLPFGYDLTPYLNPVGEENDITVMVDNSFPYLSYVEDCVDPDCFAGGVCLGHNLNWHDSHWHPNHGGLYRNTYLHVTDPLHVTLPLYSFLETQGVYVYTSEEDETSAVVNVETQIFNESAESKTFQYVAEVLNMDGAVTLTLTSADVTLAAGEKQLVKLSGRLEDAKRWSDLYPYLYTLRSRIVMGEEVIDETTNNFGVRTFAFTNDKGFFLNEHYTKLQGWGQKSTNEWAGLGAAYPDWMQDMVVKLMKDAGGNFIRWGHTAGSPTQIAISDKYGLIIDQPGVDGEGESGARVYDDVSYGVRLDALRDLVVYFRNSPSILMWEIGNQSVNNNDAVARRLREIVEEYDHHGLDGTRTNTGKRADTEESSTRAVAVRRGNAAMVPYVNVAITTEGSGGMGTAALGNKPGVEGEYNREEARRGVWDRYTPGFETYKTAPGSTFNLTAEQFAVNQVTHYKKIAATAHNGGGNWIFSDSTSHGRLTSEVTRASGEVDAVMLPKEAYYALQTIFTNEVDIYLIGHWNYPVGTVKDVFVTSDAYRVELFLNGNLLGVGTKSDSYLFTFKNVTWEAGTLKAVGYNVLNEPICESVKATRGTPAVVKMTPIIGPQGLLATGSDILLIDVEVVDDEGNRCLTFDGEVLSKTTTFTINDDNGCSIWRGGYNSGIEGSTNAKTLYLEAGINRVAVRTTTKPGDITVTAAIEGLTPATITVPSQPVSNSNGLSTVFGETPEHDISGYAYPGIGDGTGVVGPPEPTSGTFASALVQAFGYTGTSEGFLMTPAIEGKQVYTDDETILFGDLPIYLLNSDYLQLPNADTMNVAEDLMVFTTRKNVNVYLAHDDRVVPPAWFTNPAGDVTPFTDTGDDIEIGGETYSIYKSVGTPDMEYTLGGNADTGEEGAGKRMYVVFFKEVGHENDFFGDNFEDQELDKVPLGWYSNEYPDTSAWVRLDEGRTNKVVELYDANQNSDFTVIYSEFLPQSGLLQVEFKFFDYDMKLGSNNQDYVGIFLTNGPPSVSSQNDHSTTVVETYIRSGTKLSVRSRGGSPQDTEIVDLNPTTWYTVRYVVDMQARKFDAYVFGADNSLLQSKTGLNFNQNNNFTTVNHLSIRSGGAAGSRTYFDDIKVELIDNRLSDLSANGIAIPGFSGDSFAYTRKLAPGTVEAPVVTATARDKYATVEIEQAADADGTATITVTSLSGAVQVYSIDFEVAAEAQKLEAVMLGSKTYVLFDPATTSYTVALPPGSTLTNVPLVSATTNFDSAAIVQADEFPGAATVTVDTDKVYTILFKEAEYELYESFDGKTIEELKSDPAWTVSDAEVTEPATTISIEDGVLVMDDNSGKMLNVHGALSNAYDNISLKGKKIILEYDLYYANASASTKQSYIRGLFTNSTDTSFSDGKLDMAVEIYVPRADTGNVKYRPASSDTDLSPAMGDGTVKIEAWNSIKLELVTPAAPRTGKVWLTVMHDGGTTFGATTNAAAVRKNFGYAQGETAIDKGTMTRISYVQLASGGGGRGIVKFDNVRVYVIDDLD